MTVLAYTLYRLELLGKRLDSNLRELREVLTSMSSGEKYVAAAYGVVFVAVLVYVAIIAAKLARLERETAELAELARKRGCRWLSCSSSRRSSPTARPRSRTPASCAARASRAGSRRGAYGSAGSRRRRCSSARRLSAEGFPWGPGRASLNLFVWLVVGAYLIWGCTPRYRLLGLTVMPVAALAARARLGGRRHGPRRRRRLRTSSSPSTSALMLAGFAGLTLAAGMAALYLWQERRLKRHERARPARARAAARRARPAGRAQRARLARAARRSGSPSARRAFQRGDFDAAMVVTIAIWATYASLLVLRHEGWRGRRAALPQPRRLRARRRSSSRSTHFAS